MPSVWMLQRDAGCHERICHALGMACLSHLSSHRVRTALPLHARERGILVQDKMLIIICCRLLSILIQHDFSLRIADAPILSLRRVIESRRPPWIAFPLHYGFTCRSRCVFPEPWRYKVWRQCHRCLQNKRPLQNHTPSLSNPFPPKINVDEVTNRSGSVCEINTRFHKTGSALSFQH